MRDYGLFIERLPEAAALPSLLVTDDERAAAAAFGSERRRAEYLMWRHVVRREAGADLEIAYDDRGAPFLKNSNLHIGVSHSADFVAVIISPRRCAVDIERLARNFGSAARRYISPSEGQLSQDERLAAALWCSKECLYKYSGRTGLDFLEDIRVEAVDFAGGMVTGRVCGGGTVTMRMQEHEGNLVVYVG